MAEGWIVIFEGQKELSNERHPSAVVHDSYAKAVVASQRSDQVGRPLQIIKINWDDSASKNPWPP